MNGRKYLLLLLLLSLVSCKTSPAPPTLAPIDQSTQDALVSNVTPGAAVELTIDGPGGPVVIPSFSPVGANSTVVRIRLPKRLTPGQVVRARQRSGFRRSGFSNSVVVENNYVTSRYDNERSGWNPNESVLTVSKVRRDFGKLCEHPVDAAIRAQPLYVQDVDIAGKGKHNVVFVATDGDQVWAFDADSCRTKDEPLWMDTAGRPSSRSLIDTSSGERAVTVSDLTSQWSGANPECAIMLGITATPVIDRSANTIYVVGLLVKNSKVIYRLHALDITNGHDQPGSPVEISGTTVQFRGVSFDPVFQGNRPGLLLDGGTLYVAFGSHCDITNDPRGYHGWIVAYDANIPGSSGFLRQLGVFNTSPGELAGSGIWQSGLGLAADGDGTVFAMTGNGNFDANTGKYGNTVLRLRLPASSTSNEMQVVKFFTPFDWDTLYNPGDQDLGSGGPVLLTNGSKRFVLAGGKPFKSYLIDRDCTNCSGDPNRCVASTGQGCTSDDTNMVKTLQQPEGIVAGPAYYNGPSGTRVYYGFNYKSMTAYAFQPNPPLLTMSDIALDPAPTTSPIPTISSQGSSYGSGVLWAVFQPASEPAPQVLTLHAYDADDLQDNLLRRSSRQTSLDVGGWEPRGNHSGNSFQVPTVIHGRVYCGSKDHVAVFGLKPHPLCERYVDCNGAVTFSCVKDPDQTIFQLDRNIGGAWKTVTNSTSSLSLGDFVYVWDYPNRDTATYRICPKDHPEGCTDAFDVMVPRRPCPNLDVPCGGPGKPPCFLYEPWPVSPGARTEGNPPRGH
jgi:hypothetical protein